jgi:hypothetical protein
MTRSEPSVGRCTLLVHLGVRLLPTCAEKDEGSCISPPCRSPSGLPGYRSVERLSFACCSRLMLSRHADLMLSRHADLRDRTNNTYARSVIPERGRRTRRDAPTPATYASTCPVGRKALCDSHIFVMFSAACVPRAPSLPRCQLCPGSASRHAAQAVSQRARFGRPLKSRLDIVILFRHLLRRRSQSRASTAQTLVAPVTRSTIANGSDPPMLTPWKIPCSSRSCSVSGRT